jgi:hypothetical protein
VVPEGFITVVSGLPRSGTSLMMQMLNAGGLPVLTDELRVADESSPRGYFEFEPVKRTATDCSWLEQARGRAVKVIHLLVRELPTDGRFRYRVILMQRPLEEILTSQRVMLQRQGKASGEEAALRKIFQQQLFELETYLASEPAFSTLSVDYHCALQDPVRYAEKINSFLDGDLDVAAMVRAIDPALYRQRL